jgi:sulfur-carrier protein adenylyltransferase/sulfurtransferase
VFNLPGSAGNRGPNYRDMFPTPPPPDSVPGCSEAGVLGVLPGIIGTMQALEVIKIIAGIGEPLSGRLLHFDALSMQSQTFILKRKPDNPLYNSGAIPELLRDYDEYCGTSLVKEISPDQLAAMRASGEPFELIDVREPEEYESRNIGGRLVPQGEVLDYADDLPTDRKVILHCKSGARSTRAIRMLEQQKGFTNLYNLTGGIDAIN